MLQDVVLAVHGELLLFAAFLFALGLADELAVDAVYVWLRLTGRARTPVVDARALAGAPLHGPAALFIPAWREAAVIGAAVRHTLRAWPQSELTIYVGCYRNDPATQAAVRLAAAGEGGVRVRCVVVPADGPTSKAHCLNALYAALQSDEARLGRRARMVVLQDAEDMVDPAALALLDRAVAEADFVQLPVVALPHPRSPWIAGHYSDEFAEAHAKALVVRDALGCAVPGAGVGSAIARPMLELLAGENGGAPFAEGSLTEDYELGQRVARAAGRGRFLRVRGTDGRLIATRAWFPASLPTAVRQKTRWTHGIALQGWDRLGWEGRLSQRWMVLRDRRGPLSALLLALGYVLVPVSVALELGEWAGIVPAASPSPALNALLALTAFGLVWRCAVRGIFTAREFGWREGLRAVPRVVISNVVAIMSGWRAMAAYLASLRGAPVTWDKTEHGEHPADVAGTAT